MYKFLIDSNIPLLEESLEKLGEIKVYDAKELSSKDILDFDCDVLFTRSTVKVNSKLLFGSKVRFIGTATSGTDHVDLEFLQRTKIEFASAAGSNANSVAEYVIYAILRWTFFEKREPKGCTIGIIGYGNVGKLVAKYCSKLGMKVLLSDPPLAETGFEFPKKYGIADLKQIFETCDIVTNHVPLTLLGKYPTTQLIGENELTKLKAGSLFIHASRGGVVDETALLDAINVGEIYAVVDTFENEPYINKELAFKSMIATPHIAGHAYDAKLKGSLMMVEAFEEFSGKKARKSEITKKLKSKKDNDDFFKRPGDLVKLIFESRQFDQDHLLFLKSLSLDEEGSAEFFRTIRKKYPIRREVL